METLIAPASLSSYFNLFPFSPAEPHDQNPEQVIWASRRACLPPIFCKWKEGRPGQAKGVAEDRLSGRACPAAVPARQGRRRLDAAAAAAGRSMSVSMRMSNRKEPEQ